MKITVLGTGYVGLVTGAGLANFGWEVTCADIDENKIKMLKKRKIQIYELGLQALIEQELNAERLYFTCDIKESVKKADVIFICTGTPSNKEGFVDLSYVYSTIEVIANFSNNTKLIVLKSTVPVGTTRNLLEYLRENSHNNKSIKIAYNPEFLREGSAVNDFLHPERLIVGAEDKEAVEILKEIYYPLINDGVPFIVTSFESAELIKYSANSFLALKLTFINEVANLCEKINVDILEVVRGIGLDSRIGNSFLNPGPGYGGSCLQKDTKSFTTLARKYGSSLNLLEATIKANEKQKALMVGKVRRMLGGEITGKKIGFLGLAFKAETDDVRESPALKIIKELIKSGATVKAFDPHAMNNANVALGNRIVYCRNVYDAAEGSDILVIATDWNQFRRLDLDKIKRLMKEPKIADLRNTLDPNIVLKKGFIYEGVGRMHK